MTIHRPVARLLAAVTAISAISAISGVALGASAANWEFRLLPANARYATYGNRLGDPVAPSKNDTKIAFELQGQSARDMFEAMGPDRKDACPAGANLRFRSRDNEKLICTRSKEGKYACYFGFDLRSGKSIGGSLC